jgi:16S rRNA (cytidine1402-2'-O)-methyltransferase
VVVVGPPPEQRAGPEALDAALSEALETLSVKDAAAVVAVALGLPRREVYARALEMGR